MEDTALRSLVGLADPEPVEVFNPGSASGIALVCEHAGRAVPQALGSLGLPQNIIDSHRGWDIGAEDVARRLAEALDAVLVVQRYSRLVIDCNRPPGSASSIPEISDHQIVPFNLGASKAERAARVDEIFQPMDRALADLVFAEKRSAVFSIHSFTPRMDGRNRPWHAGFLSRKSRATARALMSSIKRQDPGLCLALNEPYKIMDDTDWFIPRYAEVLRLPHCLIEIRNDQIRNAAGVNRWASLLTTAIKDFLEAHT